MLVIYFVVYVHALMTQKSCAVGMRSAILRNHLKSEYVYTEKKDSSQGGAPLHPPPRSAPKLKTEKESTLIRSTVQTNPSRNRSFSETFFKPEEFENAGFSFSCGRKTL